VNEQIRHQLHEPAGWKACSDGRTRYHPGNRLVGM